MPASDQEERFATLYDENVRRLLGYAMRRVRPVEDAADVVAETFAVAWRRIDDVPPGPEATLWLYGVARRVIANQRRGSFRRQRLGDRLGQHLGDALPGDFEARSDDAMVVQAALDRLDPADRELLTLTSWEGLRPSEIALVVGAPAATIRTRLHRARRRLREELGDLAPEANDVASRGHVTVDGQPLVGNRSTCNDR